MDSLNKISLDSVTKNITNSLKDVSQKSVVDNMSKVSLNNVVKNLTDSIGETEKKIKVGSTPLGANITREMAVGSRIHISIMANTPFKEPPESEQGGKKKGGILGKMGGILGKTGMGGSIAEGAAAGGAAGAMIAVLQGIMKFVESIPPIKAAMQMVSKILTLFMMPAAMFVLGMMLPFIQFFFAALKSVNLSQMFKNMLNLGATITSVFVPVFNLLKPYLPQMVMVLAGILTAITILLVAPILGILAVITIMSAEVVLMYKLFLFIYDHLSPVFTEIMSAIHSLILFIQDISPSNMMNSIGSFFSSIPKLASGGNIYSNGLAYLHAGETVIPKGGNQNNTFNITLHSTGNTSMDMDQLSNEVYKRIQNKVRGSTPW